MPALFSKPVLATLLALLSASQALPVVTGNLSEVPWAPCGTNTWCTDLYFCAGIWENLTLAPIPPTATAGFAYAYRSNFTECIPGASPIMRVQPGQIYKVTFHNTADMDPAFIDVNSTLGQAMTTPTDIPGQAVQWGSMNMPLHTTNLHIHGSHLSGMGDHDYVLRPVLPGQCQTYIYNVGADTPGGMHIGHPHAHGRVAYQFLGGAFFPFIIDDFAATLTTNGLGRDLKGKAVDQPVKNFLTYRALERVLNAYAEFGTRMGNGDANGAKMSMTANQWFRWRILCAKAEGVLGFIVFKDPAGANLAFNTTTGPRCEMYELANDGIYLSRVPYMAYARNGGNSTNTYWVHGAERLEVAVRCSTIGNFTIEYDGGVVARVTVLATPKTNPFPQTVASPFAAGGTLQWKPTRPVWLQELRQGFPGYAPEAKTVQKFQFDISFTGINGVLFEQDPGNPRYRMQFNNSIIHELTWTGTDVHPTHIHQNHFQIVTPGGCGGLKEGEWYDVVTQASPVACVVRYRPINFTGLLIFHCHVLDHEDMGILGWIDVWPFKAPGSFEATPAFSSNTKPGYCCVPRVDKNRQMVCRGVPECGTTLGINTCNQPCSLPVNLCPANKPYCSTTGVCFQTVKAADGTPIADAETSCAAPVYPYVIMGVGLAVAAVTVIVAVCLVRRRSATYSTILIEEMKHESIHMPTTNTSPFPGHVSPFPARPHS